MGLISTSFSRYRSWHKTSSEMLNRWQSPLCICIILLQHSHQPQHIRINNQKALIKWLFHFSATLNLCSKHAFHCFSSQKYVCYISVCSLTMLLHAPLQDANGKIARIKHTFKTDPHSSIICKSLWNINHLGWFQKKACHGTFPIKMCLT